MIIFYDLIGILGLLILFKAYHFFAKVPHKKVYNWIYFSRPTIIGSSTPERAKAKRLQNIFSIAILFNSMLVAIIYVLGIGF